MYELKIMSMNCRGLGEQRKRRDVMHFIRHTDFNVIFLQDTHITTQMIPYFDNLWRGTCYHSCFSSRSRGNSILIKNSVQYNLITTINSASGNFVIVVCEIASETFAFVNIYGPNNDNPSFFVSLGQQLRQISVDHIILAGDLNFVISSEMDSHNYIRENNKYAREAFLQIADELSLIDIWRHAHPLEQKYTWFRNNPFKCGRLDMFFVSDHLLNICNRIDILPGYRSDHSIVSVTIKGHQHEKGNGFWKLNTSHLIDDDYINIVKECIYDVVRQYAVPLYSQAVYTDPKAYSSIQLTINDCLFYETLIMMIRGESVKFSKQKAKRTRASIHAAENEIIEAQNKFTVSRSEHDKTLLDIAKRKLETIREPIINGLITRSRVAWHEQGEKSSKYFLSLEKRNSVRKHIQYLQVNNEVITKTDKIIDKFTQNLQKKYSDDLAAVADETLISNYLTNVLSHDESVRLDKVITLQDLTIALNSMKKGKTPGSNGFPVEFFRTFWPEISPFLYRAFMTSLNYEHELPSHREGIITLIPKQNKSRHSLKGWRPITLLNVDYKIISAAISTRLKSVMDSLIGPAQTAYIPGRYIGENTRLVFDTMAYTEAQQVKGMILAADFEAAFESISWAYLRSVMKKFNFGPNFINMANFLFFNPKNYSRIMVNGYLGEKIYLQRGIRQGDPASGYLFNLAAALLTEQINSSNVLTGIYLTEYHEARISQYADDTILLLDGTERSLKGAVEELIKFADISGLKVNLEKTFCMPIGTLQCSQMSPTLGVKFVDEINILGIHFNRNLASLADENLKLKLPTIQHDIAQWKRRNLTPIGKICIVKTLLLSKMVHLFMALPKPTTKQLNQIQNILFEFIWGNKPDKVKRTKLIQQYSSDGLKMINVDAFIDSLKFAFLRRLTKSSGDWTMLFYNYLPNIFTILTYGSEKLKEIAPKIANLFYADMLKALARFNCQYKYSIEDILSEPIGFSNHTKYRKTKVKNWDNHGLRFVSDLFDTNTGNILSKEQLENAFNLKIDFLSYASLVRSLPSNLQVRVDTKSLVKPVIPFKINMILNENNLTKYVYQTFSSALEKNHAKADIRLQSKWREDIGDYVKGSCVDIKRGTASTYLLYFHFRIVTRVYASNKFLYAAKLTNSSFCSFCKQTTETIVHLFWSCPKVKIFVKEVLSHLRRSYNYRITVNAVKWFFLDNMSNLDVLIVTICKVSLHQARIKGVEPNLQTMLNSLKMEAQKEYYGAKNRGCIENFENKWGNLKKILDIYNQA